MAALDPGSGDADDPRRVEPDEGLARLARAVSLLILFALAVVIAFTVWVTRQ